jgi:hypothetical protein
MSGMCQDKLDGRLDTTRALVYFSGDRNLNWDGHNERFFETTGGTFFNYLYWHGICHDLYRAGVQGRSMPMSFEEQTPI